MEGGKVRGKEGGTWKGSECEREDSMKEGCDCTRVKVKKCYKSNLP